MACMEHECEDCGCVVFNNKRTGGTCPKCGCTFWHSTWDEQEEHDRERSERYSRREEE